MDDNSTYAAKMIGSIEALSRPNVPLVHASLDVLKAYWANSCTADLSEIRTKLWDWVDANGGPRTTNDKNMLFARMVLCLAYPDNQELQDVGYFDDLLAAWQAPGSAQGSA